jgi:uncharacterized protein YjbI with pentapeptide repeats
MAEEAQLKILKEGRAAWNRWREENPETLPDLTGADLSEMALQGVNLKRARLEQVNLSGTDLSDAILSGSDLSGASLTRSILRRTGSQSVRFRHGDLTSADLEESNLFESQFHHSRLIEANFRKCNLTGAEFLFADLSQSNLSEANCYSALFDQVTLKGANLTEASLEKSRFIETNLEEADLTGCRVYDLSAWNLKLSGVVQRNLVLANGPHPRVVADDLELARLINRLLYHSGNRAGNERLPFRIILIIGQYSGSRREILAEMNESLRNEKYVPLYLEFHSSSVRMIEFIKKLARQAEFIIADLTDARNLLKTLISVSREIQRAIQVIEAGPSKDPVALQESRNDPLILPIYRYQDGKDLMNRFDQKVMAPAERKVSELELDKRN